MQLNLKIDHGDWSDGVCARILDGILMDISLLNRKSKYKMEFDKIDTDSIITYP